MKPHSISHAKAHSHAPAHEPKPHRPRILLVDDDPAVRHLNAEVLSDSGYHVDTAKDGASGWRALKAHHYDVLVTDNTMPVVTGLELVKKVRSEDMTLPVVLASGTAPIEELQHHPWLHIDALLPKPYKIADLLKIIGEILHRPDASR